MVEWPFSRVEVVENSDGGFRESFWPDRSLTCSKLFISDLMPSRMALMDSEMSKAETVVENRIMIRIAAMKVTFSTIYSWKIPYINGIF